MKMLIPDTTKIESLVLHRIGCKHEDESVEFSKSPIKTEEIINQLLLTYFFSPFKKEEFFNLNCDDNEEENEVFKYASEIFEDPSCLFDKSKDLATLLHEKSNHPQIKSGEFYIAYLKDCLFEDQAIDAIGLFKSESKETYLKVYPQNDEFEIKSDDGININKLDKGCLIFNTEKENGYALAVIDNLSKASEAHFWFDSFLNVKQRIDAAYHTDNTISFCKDFITKQLPDEFDVSKADQADLLNKSVKFFKEKDEFKMEDYAEDVIKQPEVIEMFNDYKDQYEQSNEVELENEFDISENIVKQKARLFKSVIKLDKNFHVYVHGNRKMISKGFDEETGMNYYRLYYTNEQ